MTLENVLKILEITAGGNPSGDKASGRNIVPQAVRDEAMKGIRLSYANNYGAWDFIGIARGIQLATQRGIPDRSMSRMRNYFSRHRKDKQAGGFGNDASPSRGYMAWLNWGGESGKQWVDGARNNPYNPTDSRGRHIPEKYLAGLPPHLRAQRIRELGESRDEYGTGDFSELDTDAIARQMGLVKLSAYRAVAIARGFDVSQVDSFEDMARKAISYYGGRSSAATVNKLAEGLKQVYRKGLAAWKSGGHRPGATGSNWADARVASVLVGGKAAWTADKKQFALLPAAARKQVVAQLPQVYSALRQQGRMRDVSYIQSASRR